MSSYHPALFSEHFWFSGAPVAETDTGMANGTHWTMTDHLGTPISQTDTSANVYWRVEPEPYERVFRQLGFFGFSFGRDAGIRTRDPLNPIQVRYQTAPRPDRRRKGI
jgi:hypothetical protein